MTSWFCSLLNQRKLGESFEFTKEINRYLLDTLDEVITNLVFISLIDITLQLLGSNNCLLSVLDSSLVCLQLGQRLFFEFALLLLLEILNYLLISLAFKDHFFALYLFH